MFRTAAAVALFLVCAGPAKASPDSALPPPPEGTTSFQVLRNGSPIGTHTVRISRSGDQVRAEIDIDFAVSIAFIRAYSYTHRNREIWQGGRMYSMASTTDDNGSRFAVEALRSGDTYTLTSTTFSGEVAAVTPTTYWNEAALVSGSFINTQTGEIESITVEPAGTETLSILGQSVAATRYRMRGGVEKDVWYANGNWVKSTFELDGASFEYVLQQWPLAPLTAQGG